MDMELGRCILEKNTRKKKAGMSRKTRKTNIPLTISNRMVMSLMTKLKLTKLMTKNPKYQPLINSILMSQAYSLQSKSDQQF